jgi:hypothetical protein
VLTSGAAGVGEASLGGWGAPVAGGSADTDGGGGGGSACTASALGGWLGAGAMGFGGGRAAMAGGSALGAGGVVACSFEESRSSNAYPTTAAAISNTAMASRRIGLGPICRLGEAADASAMFFSDRSCPAEPARYQLPRDFAPRLRSNPRDAGGLGAAHARNPFLSASCRAILLNSLEKPF